MSMHYTSCFLFFGLVLFVIRSTRVELVTFAAAEYLWQQGTCYAKRNANSTTTCKLIIYDFRLLSYSQKASLILAVMVKFRQIAFALRNLCRSLFATLLSFAQNL